MIAFGVSIALTVDSQTDQVRSALSGDPFLLASFVVLVFFMVLANFHVLILMNGFILVALFLALLVATYVVVLIPPILLSLTVMGIIGYCKFWRHSQEVVWHSKQNGRDVQEKPTNTENERTQVPNIQSKTENTETQRFDDLFEINVDL